MDSQNEVWQQRLFISGCTQPKLLSIISEEKCWIVFSFYATPRSITQQWDVFTSLVHARTRSFTSRFPKAPINQPLWKRTKSHKTLFCCLITRKTANIYMLFWNCWIWLAVIVKKNDWMRHFEPYLFILSINILNIDIRLITKLMLLLVTGSFCSRKTKLLLYWSTLH